MRREFEIRTVHSIILPIDESYEFANYVVGMKILFLFFHGRYLTFIVCKNIYTACVLQEILIYFVQMSFYLQVYDVRNLRKDIPIKKIL